MSVRYVLKSDQVEAFAGDCPLFTYVFRPDMPMEHAPRPYFHPVHSLSGVPLTAVQPPDHPWHYGLSLAVPQVDGTNFWGGSTYVAGIGYVDRADHGQIVHKEWDDEWTERLRWFSADALPLIDEIRVLRAALQNAHAWQLELIFTLTNVSDRALIFASPAVAGRVGAGYGGLFWRGTSAMGAWQIRAGSATGETAVHGLPAPSLEWRDPKTGVHVTFFDLPTNPGFPTRWFVRQHDYPGVCIPLAFTDPLMLEVGTTLTLRYALIIGDRES